MGQISGGMLSLWGLFLQFFPLCDLSPHFILTAVGAERDAGFFPPTFCQHWPGQITWPWQSQNFVKTLTCLLSEPRCWKISRVFTLWLQVFPSAAVTQLGPEVPAMKRGITVITDASLVMVFHAHHSPVIAHCLAGTQRLSTLPHKLMN